MLQLQSLIKKNKTINIIIRPILPDIPACFHRMITSFSNIVITGNVICKLSIISSISPQICASAHTRGIPRRNIIMIEKPTRISGLSLLSVIPSVLGHKPINSKPRRFSSIAHTKSLKQNFYFKKLGQSIDI